MGGKHYAQHDDECPMLGGVRPVQQAAGAFSCRSFGRAKDLQKGDKILKKKDNEGNGATNKNNYI
jgi:hypothetical protein